jgi:hypothetical protein
MPGVSSFRRLTHPEGRAYDPVGRCIYCGDGTDPAALQREHVIPYGLNGTLLLPKASCSDCAEVTKKLEGFCLQRMLIDARTHLGLASRSRRRNKQERPLPKIGLIGPSGEAEIWQELPIKDHPFALSTLEFSPPGILFKSQADASPNMQFRLIMSPQFAQRFSKLPKNAAVYYRVDAFVYARMLAKISHAFAVGERGLGAFDPYLPEIILGRSDDVFRFVGGAIAGTQTAPDTLHRLSLEDWDSGLLTVYLRLFAFMDGPAYQIVVGKRR